MPYKTDREVREEWNKEVIINDAYESFEIRAGVNRIADWWLSQRAEDRKGLREKIENLKKGENGFNLAAMSRGGQPHTIKSQSAILYNQALSDILALLDNQEKE